MNHKTEIISLWSYQTQEAENIKKLEAENLEMFHWLSKQLAVQLIVAE